MSSELFKKYTEAPTNIKTGRLIAENTIKDSKKESNTYMEIRNGKFIGMKKF